MSPVLTLLTLTESFGDLWPQLAASAGFELRTLTAATDALPSDDAGALLIGAGGREDEALPLVARMCGAAPGTRRPALAVVGASSEYRLVASILRAGADDYFALPADLGLLCAWVAERGERARVVERAGRLASLQRDRYDFSRIIGGSAELRAALARACKVIPRAGATVLLTGETGSGKELLAQAIHYNGPRAAGPFVEVNCTALPATLLEAELFGYERGAFTDARTAKPGLFEVAHRGTLFLDEIGDLSLDLQAKLLRVLETKTIRRLGSVRGAEVDVRIIAATHVNLRAAVRAGRFRQDLYYRLSVVPVHLPPLRERGDDVLLLAEHFLSQLSAVHGMPRPALTPELRERIRAHPWPGNVRELRNAVERAVLLGDGVMRPEDLFDGELDDLAWCVASPDLVATPPAAPRSPSEAPLPFPAPLTDIARAAARAAVAHHNGNKSAAAQSLGVSRKRLYALLDREDERAEPDDRRAADDFAPVRPPAGARPVPLDPTGAARAGRGVPIT